MREIFTPGHLLIIAAVALIFFGPAKLPELGRGFGKMIREFKSGTKGIIGDDEVGISETTPVHSNEIPPAKYVEVKPSEAPVRNRHMLP